MLAQNANGGNVYAEWTGPTFTPNGALLFANIQEPGRTFVIRSTGDVEIVDLSFCAARNVGFSLSEIKELIDLYDLGDGRAEQRRTTLVRCREKIAALEAQRADIDASIHELSDFVAMLEKLEA